MPKVVFAGAFAARLVQPVRSRLRIACDLVAGPGEAGTAAALGDADVLVALAFTPDWGRAAGRLRLLQVPGAGYDRVDRAALPAGTAMANA